MQQKSSFGSSASSYSYSELTLPLAPTKPPTPPTRSNTDTSTFSSSSDASFASYSNESVSSVERSCSFDTDRAKRVAEALKGVAVSKTEEGISENKYGEMSETVATRPSLKRSNSYFDEMRQTQGGVTEARFRSMMERNRTANPGAAGPYWRPWL